jgi:hypothetical protein
VLSGFSVDSWEEGGGGDEIKFGAMAMQLSVFGFLVWSRVELPTVAAESRLLGPLLGLTIHHINKRLCI